MQHTVRVDAGARQGLAGVLDRTPFAIAFAAEGTRASLSTLSAATPQRGWTLALEAPIVSAALLCHARCTLALVNARAVLVRVDFDLASSDSPRVLARGVDRRFAPALAMIGNQVVVAYTATRDEAMHTLLATTDAASAPRDLTPPGHGAAAPTFVLGAAAPTLVMIDARAGLSPLLEAGFDARGVPSEPRVRTPVSQPSAPPLLAATLLRSGEIEVYYSLTGRLAMTAIGRVPLRQAREPTPLLPSRGYGALAFVAARAAVRTLIAHEVPSAAPPSSPRTLSLKLLDGVRTDEVLTLDGHHPSLASGAERGTFVLTYVTANGLHASALACDDS